MLQYNFDPKEVAAAAKKAMTHRGWGSEAKMKKVMEKVGFRHLGSGLYRTAWLHKESNVVVKFPREERDKEQMVLEVAMSTLLRQKKRLGRYFLETEFLPNSDELVTVSEFAGERNAEAHYEFENSRLYSRLTDWLGIEDLHAGNVLFNEDGVPKVVDLGMTDDDTAEKMVSKYRSSLERKEGA